MENFQNQCICVYEELSKAPTLTDVQVIPNKDALFWQARWSQRDIVKNSKTNYAINGTVHSSGLQLIVSKNPFAIEVKNEKLTSVSPNGKFVAKLIEEEIKNEKHYFFEIWNEALKVSNVNLTEKKKHGVVHHNSVFGCLNWSPENNKILYIAEKKLPKQKSYFDKSEEEGIRGTEYVYREDWGEQLVGTYHPTLFLYDIVTEQITDLSKYFPDSASIGTAFWSSNNRIIYALSWMSSPWKVGLIYCKNRPSNLYQINLEKNSTINLTDGKTCVFSPILTPDKTKLLYLENIPFGPHMQCSKLSCIDLNKDLDQRLLVDVIKKPVNISSFQGLFVDKITQNCWLTNGKQLIVHSIHRSNIAILSIDIDNGKVDILENEGAWKIFYVENDILFASFSSPNTPTVFKVGQFHHDKIKWVDVDIPMAKIDGIRWMIQKYIPLEVNEIYPDADFEAILVRSVNDVPPIGLIINPHGGPHSSYVSNFDVFTAAFVRLGFAVLRVNYRGSLGFGQNSVISLPQHIGCQDVHDVQQAAEAIVENLNVPSGKVCVTGGSHGGFLTLQLVGQYPNFYAAGATRNPVCNLVAMQTTTDIKDWCYCESGSDFNYKCSPSVEATLKMFECSPIKHITNVKAPLLFMLGSDDLRAPPSQAHEYVRCLKGLGKKVSLLQYDGNNHSIANINAEADCFVNTAKWFWTHMGCGS